MPDLLRTIRNTAARFGLNLIAAVPLARYDATAAPAYRAAAISPQPRSIVVLASGGGAFWRAFLDHAERHPGFRERPHPLDDFTRLIIEHHILPTLDSAHA